MNVYNKSSKMRLENWEISRLKELKCPLTDEWIKKIWVYIYTVEYYSTIEKNEIRALPATRMDLEIIILSEVSQTEKDKYYMISLICGI